MQLLQDVKGQNGFCFFQSVGADFDTLTGTDIFLAADIKPVVFHLNISPIQTI